MSIQVGNGERCSVSVGSSPARYYTVPSQSPPPTRDPLQQPFASTSIWNMPIGSSAVYVDCNYTSNPRGSSVMPIPYSDNERICLTPTAPETTVRYSSAGFGGGSRCTATNNPPAYVVDPWTTNCPIPTSYVAASSNGNDQSAHLMADNRTLLQFLCFTRCTAGGIATAYLQTPGNANHSPFLPNEDLYGSGIYGAHGASGLSAIGGSLRLGDLRPGQIGPPHVLKICVDQTVMLAQASSYANAYRWPAQSADGSWSGYGSIVSAPSACKMGALLAIPPSVNINTLGFETAPGLQMAWTFQNYGAYIVDQVGGSPGIAMSTELGYHGSFQDQFQADWGFPFLTRQSDNTAWGRDFVRCYTNFSVVDNNSATSIGGGGTPRQPLAPDIGAGP